jgi:hypothetical protein
MDHATARYIHGVREIYDAVWTLRAEVDQFEDRLKLLRRTGHAPSDRELVQAASALRALARAAGALAEEAGHLHRGNARSSDTARFGVRRAA